MAQDKQRIVILGGGVSAMASAWELTNQPGWQDRYEITLYQLGWRLGGKCASGRGPYGRIEEHGIHVLMGFYDTVFSILQSCYGEMNRPAGAPMATWQEAVAKQNTVVLTEHIGNKWIPWEFKFPYNNKIPGASKKREHPHVILRALLRRILATHKTSPLYRSPLAAAQRLLTDATGLHQSLTNAIDKLDTATTDCLITANETHDILSSLDNYMQHLLALPLVQQALVTDPPDQNQPHDLAAASQHPGHHGLIQLAEDAWHEAVKLVSEVETHIIDPILRDIRRAIISIELGYAMVRGILKDGVLTPQGWDFAAINNLDLRDWVGQNLQGIPGRELTINSAPLRGVYDLVFAYRDGVPGQYALEAGTALSFMLQIVFEFKGAIYWKMQAGMGDVVLAPLYLVLKARGVKFEFFHNVRSLKLSDDKSTIQTIEIGRQVLTTKEYDPLCDVKELPCFPAEPLYDRLQITPAEEAELRELQKNFNGLESPWTTWQDREVLTLENGKDFHRVILGISVGALPRLCPEFLEIPKWKAMLDNIKTTATQSAQLWLEPTLEECGWTYGVCVLDAYVQPLNSWTDMSDLIPREDWPTTDTPGSIAYYTGPLPNQSTPPPYDQHGYAKEQYDAVQKTTRDWMNANTGDLFPLAVVPGTQGLDFNLLIDPDGGSGAERFKKQYWRANVNPSDHYVLSVPGSSQYRLAPGDSGISNLILTGDWTLNGMNAGSVEAAADSGVQAAQALLKTI